MQLKIAIYGLMGVVALGLLILIGALGDKLARWGGYADSLPFLGLLVLFILGQLVTSSNARRRRS